MRLNRLERFLVRATTWNTMAVAAIIFAIMLGVWGISGILGSLAEAPKP